MSLSSFVASHTGVRRQTNEDSCCVRPDLGLFVVADGVGGYEAGEVASRAAVEAIEREVAATAGRTEHSPWPFDFQPALGVDGNRLNWAFHAANLGIRRAAESGRGRPGMATTVAAVLLETDANGVLEPARRATVGHVGDSRIYRFREGRLDRLTRDHSWVQEQVEAGFLSARDARDHPRRNLLTRALTGGADPVADLGWVPVAPGDRLLLCSDGLYGVLTDEQIADIVSRYEEKAGKAETARSAGAARAADAGASPASDDTVADTSPQDETLVPPESAGSGVCDALVHAANLAGGPDNITVILIRL